MVARGAPRPDLGDLPDEIVARIIALAGKEAWWAIGSTCRRFQGLLFSPAVPQAWHEFRLDTEIGPLCEWHDPHAWLAARRRQLERLGGCVQSLQVSCTDEVPSSLWPLAELLAALQPSTLQRVKLEVRAEPLQEALAQLQRLAPRLRGLELEVPALPAQLPALLQPRLEQLHLRAREAALPAGTLPAVLACTALTSLWLIDAQRPLPDCRGLTALQRLRCLSLGDGVSPFNSEEDIEPLRVPAPTAWPGGLDKLTLQCFGRPCLVGPVEGASYLRCVRTAAGSGNLLAFIESQVALPELLDAALPPGVPVAQLILCSSVLAPQLLHCGGRLHGLASLTLQGCRAAAGEGNGQPAGFEAPLRALLEQAPQLRSLRLEGCGLADLPGGPYLSGLRSLTLNRINGLARLPPALAAATALEQLDLRCNQQLELAAADAQQLLTSATRLRSLQLDSSPEHDLLAESLPALAPECRVLASAYDPFGPGSPWREWVPPHFDPDE